MFEYILLFMAGIIAGTVNAVAGGGAILVFPILLAFGLEPVQATATLYLAIMPGLVGALSGYKKELRSVPKFFLWLIVVALCGAVFGAFGLATIDPSKFETIIPWLVLSAALLLILQTRIHHLIVTEKHLVRTDKRVGYLAMVLAVFALSVYGGFFGVGAGLMIMAVIGLSSKLKNSYQLSALKIYYLCGITFVGSVIFLISGLIHLPYGLSIAVGTATGGFLGARYSHKLSSHLIHNMAVVFAVLIVAYLFLR